MVILPYPSMADVEQISRENSADAALQEFGARAAGLLRRPSYGELWEVIVPFHRS